MASIAERGISIETEEDLSKIGFPHEQQFALLLLTLFPHLKITYEPRSFESKNGKNHLETTLPDFSIFNPKNSGEIFVELTTMRRTREETETEEETQRDPKERQRRVMRNVEPPVRYIILYAENLKGIQKKHPEFNFFSEREER